MQNKTLPQLDDLYKEIILEHYREPKGRIPLERIDYKAEGINPLCGDEVQLCLQLKEGKIKKVHVEGHGCSISIASGSMLASVLEGKTIAEAKHFSEYIKNMMHNNINSKNGENIDIGDLESLTGVKKFPVRIKCALLPWTTLEEALIGHKYIEIS